MENAHKNTGDIKLNSKLTQRKFSGGNKIQKHVKREETVDVFPACEHPNVIEATDGPNIAVSTNGASSFALGGSTSTPVSFRDKNDGYIASERINADNSALVSQAQTLIDLFHEVFKTSSTSLQIVLEPHRSEDILYLEQKLGDVEGNPSNTKSEDSKEIKDHQKSSAQNCMERARASKLEHGYSLENHKELSTLQLIHRCHYCSFGSEAVSLVVEHIKNYHPNKQLRTKTISGRNCPYCGLRLEQSAFFQHMRQFHGDAHPFRCGYCSFMGRDINQVKHHCSKKHPDKQFKCFRRSNSVSSHSQLAQDEVLRLQSKEAAEGDNDDKEKGCTSDEFEEIGGESLEEVTTSNSHDCPVCKKKLKTLKYLKVHMRVHSRVRFKCGYCSYLSVYFLQVLRHCKKRHKMLQPRVKQHDLDPSQHKNVVKNIDSFMDEVLKKGSKQPADPDARKWARKYSCPHCEYTCSYGASYRRHLTLHTSTGLPFRCKYCPIVIAHQED